jgi:peptidoglycan/LPS O-acetylase OafA/YrhL
MVPQEGHEAVSRRLPYVPALDGLRGLAVLAVIAYHHGWLGGGFLGVSLFFTLSGFLIATLVVAEQSDTGRVDLGRFWARRARRLAPAALAGAALALVATAVAVPPSQRAAAAVDLQAALLQVANWRFVWAGAPYADAGVVASPVLHWWSLAIEEQFYLVFPLVALWALRRGRRTLAAVGVVVVALSLWRQVSLRPGDRVYFGTDTRAAELAVGVLLALGWPALTRLVSQAPTGTRALGRTRVWDLAGAVGLAATAALWVGADQQDPALLGGGLVAVGMLSCVVLTGALGGRVVPRALSWGPLCRVGRLSYGLYVVHFPVFLVLSPDRTGLGDVPLFVVRLAVSVALAAASLRLLETPVRAGTVLSGRRGALALVSSVLVLVAVAGPLASLGRPAGDPLLVAAADPMPAAGEGERPAQHAAVVPAGGPPAPAARPTVGGEQAPTSPAASPTAVPVAAAPTAGTPVTVAARPARLVVMGDSTAGGNGAGLRRWGQRHGALDVSVVASPGCPVLAGERSRYREGFEFVPQGCERLATVAVEEARRIGADAIVVFMGAAQLADWRYTGDERWRDITQADVVAAYREALSRTLAKLGTAGVPVLWADMPVPEWDPDATGTMLGRPVPGEGPPVTNDPERTGALYDATGATLERHAGAVVLPYAAGMSGPDGRMRPGATADGLHMSEEQAEAAAEAWLVRAIADSHRAALAELGRAPGEPLAWG